MERNEDNNSHPHSLLRKIRPKLSISLSASVNSPLTLNPHDSPAFFNCHSCGVNNGELQTLDSQWRVVLLCHACLARIRSASICSYCFKSRDLDGLVCRSCFCLVHLSCVPDQRGFITISEFDPVSFTCIDCRAIPRAQFGDPRISRVLLENLVGNASSSAKKKVDLAARARLKALKKADAARVAMEMAFDAILFARDAAVEDEQLGINHSRQAKLGCYFRAKKDCGTVGVDSMLRKLKKRRGRIHVENVKIDDAVLDSNSSSVSERNSCIKSGIAVEKKLLEIDDVVDNYDGEICNNGLTLISCRESADSNSFVEASECGRGAGEDSQSVQKEKERTAFKCFNISSKSKRYLGVDELSRSSSSDPLS